VRAQIVALSTVAFAQGIPFFHAGGELLRSKSLDRNSYNSGDWFNRLDFTYQTNNFGVGLPPASDNQGNWPLMQPLLANPALKPAPSDILFSLQSFKEMLAIRRDTALLRLRTAQDIHARVNLLNGGPDPEEGLVLVTVHDQEGAIDRRFRMVAVAINATGVPKSYHAETLDNHPFELHPVQAASHDAIVRTATFDDGTFTIPPRTSAVFVVKRPLDQQVSLLGADVQNLVAGRTMNLTAKLDAAIDRIAQGNLTAAANQLRAFVNDVQARIADGRIPPDVGMALIDEANAIIAQM
jgi:pullulanase/glycogen debranching enzyme